MTNEKLGSQAVVSSNDGAKPAVETRILPVERTGQSTAPKGAARTHTLVILVRERPGAVDRVVGLLRRRRANLQTLTIGKSEQPDIARVTAVTNDADVSIEQLIEQLRKVVDVRKVNHLSSENIVERELALIKVKNDSQHSNEIIELGQRFGAHVVDAVPEAVTLEITGETTRVEELVGLLQPFGIREVARTGSVALPRGIEYTGA